MESVSEGQHECCVRPGLSAWEGDAPAESKRADDARLSRSFALPLPLLSRVVAAHWRRY